MCFQERNGAFFLKSYIKIFGPPILKSIRTLEKIAVETPEVCIMDTIISTMPTDPSTSDYKNVISSISEYFSSLPTEISQERCSNIISKSGEMLKEYNFFFEWFQDPSTEQLNELIEKIDTTLASVGCRYTITTKK